MKNITTQQEYTSTASGSAGGCTIKNVPYGEYSYTATSEGYNDFTSSNNLTVDGDETLTITMVES